MKGKKRKKRKEKRDFIYDEPLERCYHFCVSRPSGGGGGGGGDEGRERGVCHTLREGTSK